MVLYKYVTMQTLVYTKEQFLAQFNFNKTISYADFSCRLSVLNGSDTSGQFIVRATLDDFLAKWATKDNRLSRLDLYKHKLYQMLVQEPEVALGQWFDKTAALAQPLQSYFELPTESVLSDDTFAGRTHAKYGRICKNINFENFYNTKKLYDKDFEYTLGLMKAMFEDFKIRNSLAAPAFFDHICRIENNNYSQFWTDFMVGCNRASIFNPVTYRSILDDLFEGDTLFAPCMGWNAYQLGFYASKFTHLVATDVIPEVVNNGHQLHLAWQDHVNSAVFEIQDKKVKLYCCPSENLSQATDMIACYQGQVDAVLFSPPYYDLEIYPSTDQSFSNYPDYDTWMTNYWEATVKICKQVLRPGGRFGFVISNYRNKAKQEVNISQDMRAIAEKHLEFVRHYKVQWSAISGSRQAKKTRNGNFEDLWLFEKL